MGVQEDDGRVVSLWFSLKAVGFKSACCSRKTAPELQNRREHTERTEVNRPHFIKRKECDVFVTWSERVDRPFAVACEHYLLRAN